MASVATNCVTVLLGTQGVHTWTIPNPWVPFLNMTIKGNSDFEYTGTGIPTIGEEIHNRTSYLGGSTYHSSSLGGAPQHQFVPSANELLGKKGANLGLIGFGVHHNSSLANRSVQFAAGRLQQPNDYDQDPNATTQGVPYSTSYPSVYTVGIHFGLSGHAMSKFGHKRVYNGHNKGYFIDQVTDIHLGATNMGSSTNGNASQYSFFQTNTPNLTTQGGY